MIGWLNGELAPFDALRIDPRDRGFLLGDGLFETLLSENGTIRRVRRHLTRLQESADLIGLPLHKTDLELLTAMQRVLAANALQEGRAALRLTVSRGVGPRGLVPPADTAVTILITATALGPPAESCSAIIAQTVRASGTVSARVKSLNYLDSVLARREAAQHGADEALMRNCHGRIAEASAANLFLVRDGGLVTPPVSEGALPGIQRAVAMAAALALDIGVREAAVSAEELVSADEVFLTNSLIGICPLVTLAGHKVGSGLPGPVTGRIAARASALD